MTVHFIGAGPGDPELLTLKAKRLIEEADVIVYAGSLVNPAILDHAKKEASLYDSSRMALDEIIKVLYEAEVTGKKGLRIQSGDPSIYGAIHEQIRMLEEKGVECLVVPGVSSFTAAAALLKKEFTVPEIVQTVIITRAEGRTPVPEKERLSELAKAGASMAIFLSAGLVERVASGLLTSYPPTTPIAVVYKVGWPEEKVVQGSLKDLVTLVEGEGISKSALILVGDFLRGSDQRSRLYDKAFSHEYRREGV